MATKAIGQIRFFGDTNTYLNHSESNTIYRSMDENEPNGLTSLDLSSGAAFNKYIENGGIVQLGVQSLPGTKFNINTNLDPIIIGASGMYELDLTDSSANISSLTFEDDSLEYITNNPDGYLIVDFIYLEG